MNPVTLVIYNDYRRVLRSQIFTLGNGRLVHGLDATLNEIIERTRFVSDQQPIIGTSGL